MWFSIIIAAIIIADAIVTVGGYKGWLCNWDKVETKDENPVTNWYIPKGSKEK